MFKWRLLKISNDEKLRKVVRNVSSDITWYTITIMFIAVCYLWNETIWKNYFKNQFTPVFCMYLMRFQLKLPVMTGFNLTTCDLYFTILVEVFMNHISAENHIEWIEHKIMGFKPANRYQIIRKSLLSMISIIIYFIVKQKLCKPYFLQSQA